jgi:hypothetical protein
MAYSNPANIFPPFPHLTIYSFFLAAIAPRFPIRDSRTSLVFCGSERLGNAIAIGEVEPPERMSDGFWRSDLRNGEPTLL